jgi:hypothetical protein
MHPDPAMRERSKQVNRCRMQKQTERASLAALAAMRDCRTRGDLAKLIKIAERELGLQYQIKQAKVVPRRQEFTVEICNLIGQAHVDKLKLPTSRSGLDGPRLLSLVFGVNSTDKRSVVPYVFGDESTYRDPAKPDTSFLVFGRNIKRLEERLKHSSMPIEKCYLLHEIGKQNLTQGKFSETRSVAGRIIDEAREAQSRLWEFLALALICRVDVSQKDFVKINQSLKEALTAADALANPALSDVIASALAV